MSDYQNIDFSIEGAVARITLQRPDAGNALNLPMAIELHSAARRCETDPNVRAVLLTGSGKLFCAGGDLAGMQAAGDDVAAFMLELTDHVHGAYSSFLRMRAPLVVALNGAAAGVGFSLALAGDITIASAKSSMVMAYTAAGLSPDGGSSFLLPKIVGFKRAKELAITNRKLSAQEALEWGIVNEVTEPDALMERAEALATQLSKGATNAYGSAKMLMMRGFSESLESQMSIEAREIMQNSISSDGCEGRAAFLGKRAPQFEGK